MPHNGTPLAANNLQPRVVTTTVDSGMRRTSFVPVNGLVERSIMSTAKTIAKEVSTLLNTNRLPKEVAKTFMGQKLKECKNATRIVHAMPELMCVGEGEGARIACLCCFEQHLTATRPDKILGMFKLDQPTRMLKQSTSMHFNSTSHKKCQMIATVEIERKKKQNQIGLNIARQALLMIMEAGSYTSSKIYCMRHT